MQKGFGFCSHKLLSDGHVIEFTGSYETNANTIIERDLHGGKLKIAVRHAK